jgi:AcrR family transcriptional regulator
MTMVIFYAYIGMRREFMLLRETRKRETKKLIFEQALKLFHANGYDCVTVQQIADACGIAKGTFFNYFAKKEDILLHLGESQLDQLSEMIQQLEGRLETRELIETIFGEMLQRYSGQEELMRMAVMEVLRSAALLQSESRSIMLLQKELEGIVKRAKERGGLISSRDSSSVASALTGVYFQVLMFSMMDDGMKADYPERLKEQLQIVWDGVTSRKGMMGS